MPERTSPARKRPTPMTQGRRQGRDAGQVSLSRRGPQTSEFWLTGLFVVGVLVAATVLAALDKLSADDWTKIVTGGGSVPVVGYALSRGLTKVGLGSSDESPPADGSG